MTFLKCSDTVSILEKDNNLLNSNSPSALKVIKQEHHEQNELCTSRPQYRQGRKLTAIKVYTVNDESKYLLITGVPDIKVGKELSSRCMKFGKINFLYPLPDYPSIRFELTYLVKYVYIRSARLAKRTLDGRSFFGGLLHVCYAPELESLEETREKLNERRKDVSFHSSKLKKSKGPTTGINLTVYSDSKLQPHFPEPILPVSCDTDNLTMNSWNSETTDKLLVQTHHKRQKKNKNSSQTPISKRSKAHHNFKISVTDSVPSVNTSVSNSNNVIYNPGPSYCLTGDPVSYIKSSNDKCETNNKPIAILEQFQPFNIRSVKLDFCQPTLESLQKPSKETIYNKHGGKKK